MILEISEREGEKRMHTKTESILKEGMLVLSGTGPEPYFVGNPPSGRKIPAANHNQYLMENLGLLIFSCIYCDLKDAENLESPCDSGTGALYGAAGHPVRRAEGKISTGDDIWHDSSIVRFRKPAMVWKLRLRGTKKNTASE